MLVSAAEKSIVRFLLVHGTEDKICPYGAAVELIDTITSSRVTCHYPAVGMHRFMGRELTTI